MTHPVELSRKAADVWIRTAELTWKTATFPLELSLRVAGAAWGRMLPTREGADVPRTVATAVAEEPRPAMPSQKQRRRAARNEPTPGQAARRRMERRDAESRAARETDAQPHAGAEVEVVAPWEGYDDMPAADVVQRLAGVDDTTRAAVRLYERSNQAREPVLHATES